MEQNVLNTQFQGAGGTGLGNNTLGYYQGWYPAAQHLCSPNYVTIWRDNVNKFEQAFKIIQKLIDKKVVKVETVVDFISIMNDIVEIL